MDILDIDNGLKALSQIGLTLNLDERMQLKLGCLKLQEATEMEEILFWGKIIGVSRDYYIVLGMNYSGQYEFPVKKFFWCTSANYEFAELPELNQQHEPNADKLATPFFGEPEKILEQLEKEKEEGEEEANKEEGEPVKKEDDLDYTSEEEEIVIPPKNFTELDRLGFVVNAIETDCHLVPQGAFKLIPTHEIRRNEAFYGLKKDELKDLSKYLHFRNVLSAEKKEFIEREDAVFHPNFLDAIEIDQPKGTWSIHLDSSKSMASIRNLIWAGYVAFHRAGTRIFGGMYIGNGVKNMDLPFML